MDELHVIARRVLLDALEALGEHRDAIILVGAQAIYLHTGAADLGVAEYTTDADLALDPALLAQIPPLEQALEGAGFYGSTSTIGVWKTRRRTSEARDIDVQVDLLVPATVSPGSGRRAARLIGHGAHAARKVDGLEGVLVDQAEHDIPSLEPDVDGRIVRAKVAGPGALLVAKLLMPRYPWGFVPLPNCELAVINDGSGKGCGTGDIGPVGSKPSGRSPYGVLDMVGSAAEWVDDYFGDYDAIIPPEGGMLTDPAFDGAPNIWWVRVIRGSAYGQPASFTNHDWNRVDSRSGGADSWYIKGRDLGFRCCRDVPTPTP